MFGKDKVKGHNRLIKSKSGFKVTRVGDFLRKKDDKDNTARNVVLGVGALGVLGIGTALLLKKKGSIKFPGKLAEKPLLIKKESPIKVIEETIGTPPKQPVKSGNRQISSSRDKDFITQMDEEWGVGKKVGSNEINSAIIPTGKKNNTPELRDFWNTKNTPGTRMLEKGDRLLKVPKRASGIRKKTGFSQVSDPWSTPIKSSIKESTEKVVQETNNIKLLSPAKSRIKPEPRGKLLIPKSNTKVEESVINMRNTKKNYDSLPLDMKVTVQMEKALTRPIKGSNLGRPLDTQGLKVILGDSEKLPIEKVISKAKRKISDRLKRESDIVEQKTSNLKKN